MGCDPVRVTGYVDGELSAPLAVEVERHLSTCPACSTQAAFEVGLPSRLRAAANVTLPPALERRTFGRVFRLPALAS